MSLTDKMKQGIMGVAIGTASFAPLNANNLQQEQPDNQDKYTKTISVKNDSVQMVGSTSAYYNSQQDQIYIQKGDMKWKDFGFKDTPQEGDTNLQVIHEAQHQINRQKKHLGEATVSLNENYQRDVHDEITSLIAEKLEIHRQYRAAANETERKQILDKYGQYDEHKAYIEAIREGKIKPESNKSADFDKEMSFIKNDATQYRADPNDDGYRKQWTSLSMSYLNRVGTQAQSNPEALEKEIHSIYQIGGIDFTKYGNHEVMVLENQSIKTADNLLQEGAKPEKLIAFMNEGEGPFKHAESLDVSGLSKEQAEKVLQTAIIAQELSQGTAEAMCTNQSNSFDFNFIAGDLRGKTAVYLDMKSDIWKKNGTLSASGDEAKFNRLMEEAKTITLDAKGWFNQMGNNLNTDFIDIEAVKKRVTEIDGKVVNIDDVIDNMDKFQLPLDGTSKEEVLAEKAAKAKKDADFWEEYYKKHPKEKKRLSDSYEMSIMDLESNILKDELAERQKAEQTIEPLYQSSAKAQNPEYDLPDSMGKIEIPLSEYQKAELKSVKEADGSSMEGAFLDGKPHGLCIYKDKDGNITDYKLYDKGKEIDLNNRKFEMKNEEKDGYTHSYVLLDGKKFGTEMITSPDGIQKAAAFWDQIGIIEGTENATINMSKESKESPQDIKDIEKEVLKQELKAQTGELPKPTAEMTSRQLRFDIKLKKHEKEMTRPDEINGKKAIKEKSNKEFSPTVPFWQQQQSR